MRRHFNSSERVALYLASSGVCSLCGVRLEPGWHADHVLPWSAGGPTDVVNGQALCPDCNLKKGDCMRNRWPESRKMRKWQHKAFNKYLSHESPDFMLVATPGAGKTTFALRVASELLAMGRIRRITVVVPTEHLKNQWSEAASAIGLDLDPGWENKSGSHASDYDGVCVTFAQVAANPDIHRHHCRIPTLVILDEVHHAGDGKSWGDSIRHAFEPATRRLLLSGTPFRTDNNPIPFVRYDGDGKSIADFSCSYPDALREGVCRPVLFPSYEGKMNWYSRGQSYEASFQDEISQRQAAQRLKTALDPSGEWMRQVIVDADAKLRWVRQSHPEAAGLIVAMDKIHAEGIARLLRSITGDSPIVVTSDDPDASRMIAEFSKGRRPWIIAIRMVSEGVDIPRLRVGVYATNVTTELYFRQFVGRFVRMTAGLDDQNAYVFIPKDDTIFSYALRIAEERRHQLEEEIRESSEQAERDASESDIDDKVLSLFVAISSTGQADDVVYDQDVVTQSEIREAETLRDEIGAPPSYDAAIMARFARKVRAKNVEVKAEARISDPTPRPLHEQKKTLRKIVGRYVAQIREITDGRLDYPDVYTMLMKRDGVSQDQATIEQLNARINYLKKWVEEYRDGG